MKINNIPYRTIWPTADGAVEIIDQTRLPHEFVTVRLESMRDAEFAIRSMQVRGAPLIGVAAAYGVALSMKHHATDAALKATCDMLAKARPTAVNLSWAVERMRALLLPLQACERADAAWLEAGRIAEQDVKINQAIGRHGREHIQVIHLEKGDTVNILTHCNAGWLATVDWGTALAPVYTAFEAGIPLHVWVDETRPRNQGASLTAWELAQHGIPHTVIVDNAGGHLMQHGLVDMVIVGCDRVTAHGDVCNKIGTYLKALAAFDNGVPFYVAMPISTLDLTLLDGVLEIPIEEREQEEVTHVSGLCDDGQVRRVRLTPEGSKAANYGFDVTPARLVTGLITERGVVAANTAAILAALAD
ncbi:S-methyl-5-thioribose-1-phosphate isomerase [Gallionella capsiferriformans]|uniref:Methylthioribose-1-phosphate isomerase n=1 Tax=Gallionella capsiferriformans (strain ES-2) TaxID=395494 RepID=D9SCX1_GALCS|nr:S-methyl-5-thioribose-1-phosphate isomerase [Gallionella capsiferriformans]ADL54660.1 translation initiation factor, aIF-2BI family [Gallionella capsiferriformans ES-2]